MAETQVTSLVATTLVNPQMTFKWQAVYIGPGQVQVTCNYGGGSDSSNTQSRTVVALTPGVWPCFSTPVSISGTNPNINVNGTLNAYWFDTRADPNGSQPGYVVWFTGNMVYPNVNDVAGTFIVAFCDEVGTAVP
jgi:hypothetical protein